MIGNVVARRYARAIFSLGQESGLPVLEKFGEELAELAATFRQSPQLERIFSNPVFLVSEKKALVTKILAAMEISGTMQNLCLLLADKNRLDQLEAIHGYYTGLLDSTKGIVRGQLTTAIKLASNKQKSVLDTLEKQAKRKLDIEFAVDPDIIGGVVLTVGDRVLDASVRAQLGILKDNIKRGE